MKRPYRMRLRGRPSWSSAVGYVGADLSEETLLAALGHATVHYLRWAESGGAEMDVELGADSPQDATRALLLALETIGLDTTRIVIIDLAKAAIQRAVIGGTGLGALGAASRNPWAAFTLAVIGVAVGLAADVAVNETWAMILAERVSPRGAWRLRELSAPSGSPQSA